MYFWFIICCFFAHTSKQDQRVYFMFEPGIYLRKLYVVSLQACLVPQCLDICSGHDMFLFYFAFSCWWCNGAPTLVIDALKNVFDSPDVLAEFQYNASKLKGWNVSIN